MNVQCPIIFTTAYDKYAIDAFNTNGIDYLLKSIEEDRLKQAVHKARQFSAQIDLNSLIYLSNLVPQKQTKSRFMVKVGEKIKSISVDDIKLFHSYEKATWLHTRSDREYIIDYSLDDLQHMLDSTRFFKINRKYIVSIDDQIIDAREKVQEFKQWLDR